MKYGIIGNGVAAVTCAEEIRKCDKEGSIQIFGDEPYLSYNRPKLIKYLYGEASFDELLLRKESWYSEKDIEVITDCRIERIDLEKKEIVSSCNKFYSFDKLLIATGSSANKPPVEGVDKENVLTFRTVEDADNMTKLAKESKSAAIVGGGLLGLETACILAEKGLKVTIVDRNPWLLRRQLDEEGSKILQKIFKNEFGISIELNAKSKRILNNGQKKGVELEDGRFVDGEIVNICAGVKPEAKIAKDAGIKVNKGIIVDSSLSTSHKDVFAAGDVTEFEGTICGIVPNALEQAKIAAINMVGDIIDDNKKPEYNGTLPFTKLKVPGVDFVSIGEIIGEDNDKIIIEQDNEKGIYKKAVIREGLLAGSILLGDKKSMPKINKYIRGNEFIKEPENIFK